jgi:lipopolysaccharide transport system permease protein
MITKINPRKGWHFFTVEDFKELLQYKDLLYMLVGREISVLYKQTVFGFAWAIFRPLVQMVIFTFIFGKLVNMQSMIGTDVPYAVFSFTALVPWTYFAVALNSSTGSLIGNQQFFTKVYFPRMIIPITPIISKLLDFAIAFIILLVMLFAYGIVPNYQIVFLPLLVLLMMMTALGMSLWLSALAIQYRDVSQFMQFFAQLLMYAAPVIWPITLVPQGYRFVYGFYPMAGVIEGFRASLIGQSAMPWDMIGAGFITATILMITGVLYFRSRENVFADVV